MFQLMIGAGLFGSLIMLVASLRRVSGDARWATAWFGCTAIALLGILLARELSGPVALLIAILASTAAPSLMPLQYLHVRAVTGDPQTHPWPHLAVPAGNLIVTLGVMLMAGASAQDGVVSSGFSQGQWINALTLLVVIALGFYPATALRRLWAARRKLAGMPGRQTRNRYDWLIAWCALSFVGVLAAVLSDLRSILGAGSTAEVAYLASGALTLQVVVVGIHVSGTIGAFDALKLPDTDALDRDAAQLDAWMRENAAFREAGLSLERLSERLDWTVSRTGSAVRASGAQHFNDYLNRWRVEAVKQALKDQPDTALLELALDAGFGSKSSFNDAFKRHVGQTPSEYRRSLGATG